ncbi:MAG: GNAT family N-acetyltransferase [Candidatus Cloacimonetes bacterium]|nr:GNAT family N-acetyltransferase [Candidatus Cloacimonadota bacterium]
MKIIDLTNEHLEDFLICLEDWSDYMAVSGVHKREWVKRMLPLGLRVKLALGDDGILAGFIQYAPIEHSFVLGKDLYFVFCIWIHGHKAGRGDLTGKGMGKALLKAAEEDAKALGSKGLVVWGIDAPFWMTAAWFEKHGYEACDRQEGMVLLIKKFADDAQAPSWVTETKIPPVDPGVLTIHAFKQGWCPGQNATYENAKAVAAEFGARVRFVEYDTQDRKIFAEWGHSDIIFLDDQPLTWGPPLSKDQIREKVLAHLQATGK